MATDDKCVTIQPYFSVQEGQLEAFKAHCEGFVEATLSEEGCLYYGFSFDGNEAFCREGYVDAEAALVHLGNVAEKIDEVLQIAEFVRLEVHGPADELAKLAEPLAEMNPRYFALEYGFRR
ncbi:MAG: antibiotic biosynthesis monooxygenase [Acidobacteriota bacterium]|jgi:quinol monooxygenase YgiN